MEKKTESKILHDTSKELEIANLRAALADERIKTEALSRRCIQLSAALDEDAKTEKEMIDMVNRNSARRKAEAAAKKRLRKKQQEIEAYEKACTRNAVALGLSMVIGSGAVILSIAGIIHPVLGAVIAGVSMIAFGWALNDCVYLLGRCE